MGRGTKQAWEGLFHTLAHIPLAQVSHSARWEKASQLLEELHECSFIPQLFIGPNVPPKTILTAGVTVQNKTDDITGLMELLFY